MLLAQVVLMSDEASARLIVPTKPQAMRVCETNGTATAIPCAYLCHLTNHGLPEFPPSSLLPPLGTAILVNALDLERLLAFAFVVVGPIQPAFDRATAATVFSTASLAQGLIGQLRVILPVEVNCLSGIAARVVLQNVPRDVKETALLMVPQPGR